MGWALLVLGLTLSFAGLFWPPRALAIAGVIISVITGVLFVFVYNMITIFLWELF